MPEIRIPPLPPRKSAPPRKQPIKSAARKAKEKLDMATAVALSLPILDARWKRIVAAAAATGGAALGLWEAFGTVE